MFSTLTKTAAVANNTTRSSAIYQMQGFKGANSQGLYKNGNYTILSYGVKIFEINPNGITSDFFFDNSKVSNTTTKVQKDCINLICARFVRGSRADSEKLSKALAKNRKQLDGGDFVALCDSINVKVDNLLKPIF